MVYVLDYWPPSASNNFVHNNCLLFATNIVKNNDKVKYMYSGYEIVFDFARNVIVFGVDNMLLYHANNQKNVFLVLGEGLTNDINERVLALKKQNFKFFY